MRNNKIFWLMLSIIVTITGCGEDNERSSIYKPINLGENTRSAAEQLKPFYVDFTTGISEFTDTDNTTNGNVVVSPISVSTVLSMTANAAGEELKNDILSYLGVSNLESLNELNNTLTNSLPKIDPSTTLGIANSVWYSNRYSLAEYFEKEMKQSFNAPCNKTDFTDKDKTLTKMNDWCRDASNGKITQYFNTVNDWLAVLINSVYFKSEWHEVYFNKDMTEKEKFYGSKHVSETDMMHADNKQLKYNRDESFEYFSLTFGNGAYSIHFFLPSEDIDIKKVQKLLTPEKYNELTQTSVECLLTIWVPKFNVDMKLELNDVLKATGIRNIDTATSLPMFESDIEGCITLRQATCFEINEDGVKAAAVSSSEIWDMAAPLPGEKHNVSLNRPFFFFITEKSTEVCILSGRIMNLDPIS